MVHLVVECVTNRKSEEGSGQEVDWAVESIAEGEMEKGAW